MLSGGGSPSCGLAIEESEEQPQERVSELRDRVFGNGGQKELVAEEMHRAAFHLIEYDKHTNSRRRSSRIEK